MIARQLWPYEEPTTPGEIPDHEYLEIVDRRPKTSDNGQQISMPLYNHLNSLVHVNKKDMKIKRQKLILCFMLGCVFSASIMAPLIFIFREPHLVLNKEKYGMFKRIFKNGYYIQIGKINEKGEITDALNQSAMT